MTLRTKTLIIISVTLVGLIVLVAVLTRPIVLDGFAAMDTERTEKDLVRVEAAIEREVAALSTLASDWGGWDGMYDYVETGDEDFARSNLIASTFEKVSTHLMNLFYRPSIRRKAPKRSGSPVNRLETATRL